MPFLLILIGAVLLVSAINNTQSDLATALEKDVPGFLKWAAGIIGIGVLGWVPGMREISRWLLALVLVVIVLRNYQQIFGSLTSLTTAPQAVTPPQTPAQTYAASVGHASNASAVAQLASAFGGTGGLGI